MLAIALRIDNFNTKSVKIFKSRYFVRTEKI